MVPHLKNSFFRIAFLLAGIVAVGRAQSPPATCTASVQAAANVRGEGQAELVADYVVTCTGGTPARVGSTLPTVDFTATLQKTNVTSRVLSAPWSEALLLMDDPAPASQLVCTTVNGICPITATG